MSQFQAVALSAAVFVTVVSAQVALARRAKVALTVLLAVVAVLAMAGAAFMTLRAFVGSGDMPSEIVHDLLFANAGFWGIPLLATTIAALLLARRHPKPRASLHWAVTAIAGLLMYPIALQARERFGFDMVNAVQDGPGPRVVVHPTPEERIALARTLPHCSIRPMTIRSGKGWQWEEVKRFAARIPMPAEMRAEPDDEGEPYVRQWEHDRWGIFMLVLNPDAQYSPGFSVSSGRGITTETSCRLQIGSNILPITRSAAAVRRQGGGTVDSVFGASTDIPLSLPDTQIGVGIVAHSRAGRDTLLSILAAMHFADREQTR